VFVSDVLMDVFRFPSARPYVREEELPGSVEACGQRMVVRQLRGYHCQYVMKTQYVETRSTVTGIPEGQLVIRLRTNCSPMGRKSLEGVTVPPVFRTGTRAVHSGICDRLRLCPPDRCFPPS
jgi:hypothetical protein